MTQTMSDVVQELRSAMAGAVLTPGDAGYDEARSLFNGEIGRRPALIAMCRTAADVAAAVLAGQRHGLEITVRGGGHSLPGYSVSDGGLMIHLGEMRAVTVDPAARRARVQGGATLAEMDAATQAHGLATTGGTVSHTGVAGLTLGGGMGWLSRRAGLAIDNLVSAEVVTADGRILRASETAHPDLFWAIRGGGGNFGVVTSFEFALHEVGPTIRLGMGFWGLDDGAAVLRVAEEINAGLPLELNLLAVAMTAPAAPFVPAEHHFRPGYALLLAGFGTGAAHDEYLARIRAAVPPLFEFSSPISYVELQKFVDAGNPWGWSYYEKGCYLESLSESVIDTITEHVPRKASPQSMLILLRLDGTYCEVGDDDTAFSGGRSPRYSVFIPAVAPTPELLAPDREWVRDLWDALQPHTIGRGGYVNALEARSEDRVRLIYGDKYEHLARIKATYDPDNVFHHNANIIPLALGQESISVAS